MMFAALAALLYLIAIAMIGGGGWTAFEGLQWFPAERAVAQYIAGAGVAAGGCVLFGIATLVLCLGKVNRTLRQAQSRIPAEQPHSQVEPAPVAAPAAIAAAGTPVIRNIAGELPAMEDDRPGLADGQPDMFVPTQNPESWSEKSDAGSPDDTWKTSRTNDDFSFAAPRLEAEAPKSREGAFDYSHAPSRELPSSPTSHYYEEPKSAVAETNAADTAMFAKEFSYEAQVSDVIGARAAAPVEEKPKPAATVVGSYESGGNRYVMYSDGTIEAHLPSGVRFFRSLDELKQFISS